MTSQSYLFSSALLIGISGCAHTATMQQTAAVSRCVVSDARLGKVIVAPKEAKAYLQGVAEEAHAIVQARKANPDGDFSRERELIADILDLIHRLQACIDEGGTVEGSALVALGDKVEAVRSTF